MNRLALAVKAAADEALSKVSLESIADDMDQTTASFDQQINDINDLMSLSRSLESIVISFEAFESPSIHQQNMLRSTAVGVLANAQMSPAEIRDIFPSLEAEGSSAWQKFKDFIARLWKFICDAAVKIYNKIDQVLKESNLAEKLAMQRNRNARIALDKIRDGLTIKTKIKLRPAHRYLFAPDASELGSLAQIKSTVDTFRQTRDAIERKLPDIIIKTAEDIYEIVDALALVGTDAEISASIESKSEALLSAVRPMFPGELQNALGLNSSLVPLIYDRAVQVNGPEDTDYQTMDEAQLRSYVSHFGLTITQVDHPRGEGDELGEFPALRQSEIRDLIALAGLLVDETHSADQKRRWRKVTSISKLMNQGVTDLLKTILRKDGLTVKARTTIQTVLAARHAISSWVQAPFVQVNTVNVRVVNSLLALAEDQIKNFEVQDKEEDRRRAAREEAERKRRDAAKPKDDKKA